MHLQHEGFKMSETLNSILTHSDIADVVNNYEPIRQSFNTYLRGSSKVRVNNKLTALDIQELLASRLSPFFKRMFAAALAMCEVNKENIRAIFYLLNNPDIKLHEREFKNETDNKDNFDWFKFDHRIPKQQRTSSKQTVTDLSIRVVEINKLFAMFFAMISNWFKKIFLRVSSSFQGHEKWSKSFNYNLSFFKETDLKNFEKHVCETFLSVSMVAMRAMLQEFLLLSDAPAPEKSTDHIKRLERLRGEIIYCQQVCIRLSSHLNYHLDDMYIRTPKLVTRMG